MPIRRFLDDHAFDPEVVNMMSEIYVAICEQLKLNPHADDPMTRRIATAVIQAIEDGEKLKGAILLLALAKLGVV